MEQVIENQPARWLNGGAAIVGRLGAGAGGGDVSGAGRKLATGDVRFALPNSPVAESRRNGVVGYFRSKRKR